MNGVRAAGFLPERHFEAPFVELVDGVSHGLGVATQRAGDLVGVLAPFASKQDLAERRRVKASGERKPASRVSRSASERGRTKIGRFISWRITLDYHLVWGCTSQCHVVLFCGIEVLLHLPRRVFL